MNAVMGDGMTSRLFMEIRERRGLAYEVHSSSMHYRDCGALMVYCGVDTAKAEDTIQAVLDEMAKMSEGITPNELSRAVEYACGRLDLRLEDTRAVMSWLGGQELLRDKVIEPDEIVAELRKVTIDQIVDAAQTYLKDPSYRLAVVGPYKSDTSFRKLLG